MIVRAVIESIVIERALRALSAHYARYCAIIALYQIEQIAPETGSIARTTLPYS